MTSFFKHKIVPAALAVFAFTGIAQAERLTCQFPENDRAGGWVSVIVVFDIDANGQAIVDDGAVQEFNGGPMVTRVRTNNAKRLTMTWDLDTQDSIGQISLKRYTAFIDRRTMEATILVQPRGYLPWPRAHGECR
ncbi:hypothetical protein [Halocynthiibacter namhaensis]|uniref:hypothetical protein n=1 Tax=Halocynthiibacter namhaensis TaxID=1290553 RepID=UPI0005790E9B|nr:hypothetical protein [Halocynthiibacter namhaensis]